MGDKLLELNGTALLTKSLQEVQAMLAGLPADSPTAFKVSRALRDPAAVTRRPRLPSSASEPEVKKPRVSAPPVPDEATNARFSKGENERALLGEWLSGWANGGPIKPAPGVKRASEPAFELLNAPAANGGNIRSQRSMPPIKLADRALSEGAEPVAPDQPVRPADKLAQVQEEKDTKKETEEAKETDAKETETEKEKDKEEFMTNLVAATLSNDEDDEELPDDMLDAVLHVRTYILPPWLLCCLISSHSHTRTHTLPFLRLVLPLHQAADTVAKSEPETALSGSFKLGRKNSLNRARSPSFSRKSSASRVQPAAADDDVTMV